MAEQTTYWVCKCGDKAVNTPDGEGLRTMRLHKMQRARAGERGHHILGLFAEDGTCLVAGDNPQEALKKGYLTQKPESKLDKRRKKEEMRRAAGGGSEAGGGGGGGMGGMVKSPASLIGIVPTMRIVLPASVWGWMGLGFRYLRKEDGSRFEWTPEDVSEYISKVIQFFHMEHLPMFFNLTREQAARPDIRKQLDTIIETINGMSESALPVDLVKGVA